MAAWTAALLGVVLAAPNALGTQVVGPGVEEVQKCAERNEPKLSARQQIVLVRKSSTGESIELRATLLWKRADDGLSRVLVRVEEPPDERGTAFLLIEREGQNDMFSYLPEYRKVRRITPRSLSGSFLGTDLSYEDVEELERLADHAKVERLPDESVDGRAAYALVGYPAEGSGSAYRKVVSQVDRETCVLRRAALYGAGEEPLKEIRIPFDGVEKQGGRWIPRKVSVIDHEKGSETTITVKEIELDVDIPDRTFSESELNRTGH